MTRTVALPAVEGVDNRGTAEVPFGFVYFNNTRVGFASNHGIFRSAGWVATGWHVAAAIERLKIMFPDHEWKISTGR